MVNFSEINKNKKMETKKAIVRKVVHNTGTFKNNYGQFYTHEITFDNGDKGGYSSKTTTCTKFEEGKESWYTIEPNGDFPPKIKPAEAPQYASAAPETHHANGGKMDINTQKSIIAQTSIKATCDLFSGSGLTTAKAIEEAEEIYNWILKKSGI